MERIKRSKKTINRDILIFWIYVARKFCLTPRLHLDLFHEVQMKVDTAEMRKRQNWRILTIAFLFRFEHKAKISRNRMIMLLNTIEIEFKAFKQATSNANYNLGNHKKNDHILELLAIQLSICIKR